MKLARFGQPGRERPALIAADGRRHDASALATDWDGAFFADGGLAHLRTLSNEQLAALPVVDAGERWAAPVARPGKVIGIGLNYADHAREAGMAIPTEPIVFMKATTAVCGPFDDIRLPRGSTATDWEVELAILIGSTAQDLPDTASARAAIAGWMLANDVSERDWQLRRGGQWDKGKSFDTFCPLGPWLLTADELLDPAAVALELDVNGQRRQRGSTATMIFDPATIVQYLSQCMTLEAGDVIVTGTPPGVGMGSTPPAYLRAGDVVELRSPLLGAQRSRVVT